MKKKILLIMLLVIIISLLFLLNKAMKDTKEEVGPQLSQETEAMEEKQDGSELPEGKEDSFEAEASKEKEAADDVVYLTGQLTMLEEYENENDTINIYENLSLGIDADFLEKMTSSLSEAGWNELKYTIWDEQSFCLKCSEIADITPLSEKEYLEQMKIFLDNSGLSSLFAREGIEYELEYVSDVGFCYLLCNGARTGSYLRFVYEDSYVCEECQAYLYVSKCIDTMEIYPLEEALEQAFYIAEYAASSIDSDDYSINHIEIVYVDGIPFYQFVGYGVNTRTAIQGYAPAVNMEPSEIKALHFSLSGVRIIPME